MHLSPFGTDPHVLHRTGAVDTSERAAYSVDSAGLEERVYRTIRAFGTAGCTQDDVLHALSEVPYPSITARFSALLRKNLIVDTGARRPGHSGRMQRVVRDPTATDQLNLFQGGA